MSDDLNKFQEKHSVNKSHMVKEINPATSNNKEINLFLMESLKIIEGMISGLSKKSKIKDVQSLH